MAFLADVDQTSKILKICSKNVLGMVGASLESLKAIVSEKILHTEKLGRPNDDFIFGIF